MEKESSLRKLGTKIGLFNDRPALYERKNPSWLLAVLGSVFVGVLLASNILANHMIQIGPWVTTAGLLTFPITYIISDILSEVYGYNWARRIAWTSFGVNAFFAGIVALVCILPQPVWYDGTAFATALNGSWRIVVASLIAYLFGKWADDVVFQKLRGNIANKEMKGYWIRSLGSSLLGNIVDTSIFCLAAFSFVIPWAELPGMILLSTVFKQLFETCCFPLNYKVTSWVKKKEISYEES